MSAVFLNEYNLDSPVITVIRLSIANLAGVPSIIFGLFGLTFFVVFCGFGVSLLSGILTLAVLSLPIIINTTETALKQIPQDWREASLALGATRFETIMKVILPNALPGILTGAILALARAAGETAAVMYTGTVFFTQKDGVSLFEPVMALPYHVYVMATSGTNIEGTRHLQYGIFTSLPVKMGGVGRRISITYFSAKRYKKTPVVHPHDRRFLVNSYFSCGISFESSAKTSSPRCSSFVFD